MKKLLLVAVAGLLGALPTMVCACGACDEDKVAATYDHAIVTRAAAKHQLVVFGAIDGALDARAVGAKIVTAAQQVKGVARGSVHTSVEPAAVSFVLDPRVQTPEAAMAELERRLGVDDARLAVIRVIH
jgi:hypothetical protein